MCIRDSIYIAHLIQTWFWSTTVHIRRSHDWKQVTLLPRLMRVNKRSPIHRVTNQRWNKQLSFVHSCSWTSKRLTTSLIVSSSSNYLHRAVFTVMPHFAESQFAENPCNLLIFLKRNFRWRQTKLTLTVTLTLTDTVTVIFLRAFRTWHP